MTLKQSPYAADITELLQMLPPSQLLQLAGTATHRHIVTDSKKEAVEIILRYTESLERLFSYKRITSQLLFEYLHHKKVPLRTGESKQEMIEKIKKEWVERQKAKPKTKAVSLPKTNKKQNVSSFPAATPKRRNNTTELNLNVSGASNASLNTSINLNLSSQDIELSVKMMSGGGSGGGGGGGGKVMRSDVFAVEFCKWFYVMLNRLQPQGAGLAGENFSPDAFTANCSMDIYLCDTSNTEKHAMGQDSAYALFKSVCTDFRLMFSPHLDSGVRAEMSQHGLVKLYCLGTLHQGDAFVGVFEQEFGLVKGPREGWKIAMTKVNLKQAQQNSVSLPTLPQAPVFDIPV